MRVSRKGLVAAVVGLALLMVFSTLAAAADGFREGYELGIADGKRDTPLINIVWGIVGNVIAFGVAAFSRPPDPSAAQMMKLENKSTDYKAGYLEGYAQSRQSTRLMYVGGGALLPTLMFLILIF